MSMCDERASTLITFIEKAENWNSFWKGKKTSLSYVSRRYFWELKKLYFRIDLDQCTRTFFSKIFFNLLSISEKNMASVWSTFILLKYCQRLNKKSLRFIFQKFGKFWSVSRRPFYQSETSYLLSIYTTM